MDAPVVACAVRIWRLIQAPLDPLEAALLMQSPFVSGALAERGARSQAAYTALAEGVALDLRAWAALARSVEAREGAAIAMRLASVVRAWPARERASVWASLMMNALGILGWPGAAGQAEYQAVAALRDVLESVAGLDAVATPMSYDQALVLVQEALAGRVFQAGESEAPLQIMGPLEAVGLSFDGLWVLNLQDRVWPAIRQPHPLLPLTFQREHHLPHADIEDDVRYTQALTSAFVGAAPEVCLSAARHDGIDPQRPSRVLEAYAPQDASAPPFAGRAARLFASRPSLEDIPETKAPLREPRKGGYGVGLFAAQAGCPFKAAAQYRLQADPLAAPTYGLAPSVRGDLLHIALEQLFRGLPDQAALTALSAGAKEQQVKAAVEGALAYAPEAYHGLPKAFVVLEAKRYQDLLRDFLALEESRAPFRVQACEQEVKFACGPLTARGRIDRIDEIAGELVLIDYKTGKVPVLDWTSERPLHPQLLFYATAQGPAVAGFAYASLSAQGSRYKAWTRVADLLPGATVIPEWTQMAASWPGILRHLAEEFAAGHAAVDPEPGACDYCGRESFCRVGQWGPDDDR